MEGEKDGTKEEARDRRERPRAKKGEVIKGEKKRRGHESLNRPGAMIDSGTALLLGAWLRSNKHECTGKVTKKAGYGGVFT